MKIDRLTELSQLYDRKRPLRLLTSLKNWRYLVVPLIVIWRTFVRLVSLSLPRKVPMAVFHSWKAFLIAAQQLTWKRIATIFVLLVLVILSFCKMFDILLLLILFLLAILFFRKKIWGSGLTRQVRQLCSRVCRTAAVPTSIQTI